MVEQKSVPKPKNAIQIKELKKYQSFITLYNKKFLEKIFSQKFSK